MFKWVCTEINDLLAMKDCIDGIHRVQKLKFQLRQKMLQLKEDLDNQTMGKKNVRSVWRSITGKKVSGEVFL